MILRDAEPCDLAAVRGLIGQLGYAPGEAEFLWRLERVLATASHRLKATSHLMGRP